MNILGIESSCDETACAIISANKNDTSVKLLSQTVTASMPLHAKTGGIIPENAAREQLKYILPIVKKTLKDATMQFSDIDAFAVTYGPGLIGSLLVGVETAKTFSFVFNKPLVPINHLIGHIYANWVDRKTAIEFLAIALIVSGGHTDLILMKKHGSIQWLGGTRDDAAGEALDKIGRLLGLPYPAGPAIEEKAKKGNPKTFRFKSPMIDSHDFDFSFSGLKTAVLKEVQKIKRLDEQIVSDIAYAVQVAIFDVLIAKTTKAAKQYNTKSILLGGGVSANKTLRTAFEQYAIAHELSAKIFAPQKFLCTDNAAMIATAAFFNYNKVPWQKLTADPKLYFN